MSKFTLVLLLIASGLIAYWLLQGPLLPATRAVQPVVAQAGQLAEQSEIAAQATEAKAAKPTVAPLFRMPTRNVELLTSVPEQSPTRTLRPTPQATTEPPTMANILRPAYAELVIYGDELNPSWSIDQSSDTQINLWDNSHWFQRFEPTQERNSSATAIAVSPQADYGTLFFTVRPESDARYERQKVLGVSFWLHSGSDGIATDALAVAVVGSNALPYWTASDHSVFPDQSGSFSETRLYFLKINRTIPASTWINVVVWLDDLEFDPFYRYVTGFYIKNEVGFRSTYYVDQVALLLAP